MSAWTRAATLAVTAAAAAGVRAWQRSREDKAVWASATDELPEENSGMMGEYN